MIDTQCVLCVFVFFTQLDLRPQPMCFTCFCAFFIMIIYERFSRQQQGQTPNVFYVFLCFFLSLPGISFMYFMCFCVFFVFFPQIYLRPQPMCFTCFCVFLLWLFRRGFQATTRTDTQCVLRVFVFFPQFNGNIIHVFYVFLCFLLWLYKRGFQGHGTYSHHATNVFYVFVFFCEKYQITTRVLDRPDKKF